MNRNRPPQTVAELQAAMTGVEVPGKAMLAKYDGECGWCGQAILAGDVIGYLPADKCVLCAGCAVDEGP